MAERLLQISSIKNLKCGCLPFNIRLCVPEILVDPLEVVVNSTTGNAFVLASVVQACKKTLGCSEFVEYTINYDDIQLASYDPGPMEADVLLLASDISDIFCDDCELEYVQALIDAAP